MDQIAQEAAQIVQITQVVLSVIIMVYFIFYFIRIFFILSLCKTMGRVPSQHHKFPRWFLWMFMIPIVGFIFSWIMIPFGVPYTLRNAADDNTELTSRAKSLFVIGLVLMITHCLLILPILNVIALPACFVLWIVYWAKVVSIRKFIKYDASDLAPVKTNAIDKGKMPKNINIASWLVWVITLFYFGTSIYGMIKAQPIHALMRDSAASMQMMLATKIPFAIWSIALLVITYLMFGGLRAGNRGFKVFATVLTSIGLFYTVLMLAFIPFVTDLYTWISKTAPQMFKPDSLPKIIQLVQSGQVFLLILVSIQLVLLLAFLRLILSKKSKAWFD